VAGTTAYSDIKANSAKLKLELSLSLVNFVISSSNCLNPIWVGNSELILPIPGEAKAKAMPGWLYIHTKG
jgi:hypothetical protein